MEGWDSGAYREILPANSPFPTSVIWWSDVTKTKKIIQTLIFRNGLNQAVQIVWAVYKPDGLTVIATVTDAISYIGPFESSRTRTVT